MGEGKCLSVHRPTSNKSLVTYSLNLTIASAVSRLAIDICACFSSNSDATKLVNGVHGFISDLLSSTEKSYEV